MAYRKLSEIVMELEHPQQSDRFVKMFRNAVREGDIDAIELKERFTLPKQYKRRGGEGSYERQARDMVFEATPKSEKWIGQAKDDLSKISTRGGRSKVVPSLETVESGEVDFKALVEETRRNMESKYNRGQQLGSSRKQRGTKKK
ncbi:hypothetical protein ACTQ9L_14235 [Deinococcus wulumuqiensis]